LDVLLGTLRPVIRLAGTRFDVPLPSGQPAQLGQHGGMTRVVSPQLV
jgi:hypothetical protein